MSYGWHSFNIIIADLEVLSPPLASAKPLLAFASFQAVSSVVTVTWTHSHGRAHTHGSKGQRLTNGHNM